MKGFNGLKRRSTSLTHIPRALDGGLHNIIVERTDRLTLSAIIYNR